MSVVALYNLKGGVGKTSAAVNLAWLAARDGSRVLLWDLDPQASASYCLRTRTRVKKGTRKLIAGRVRVADLVRATEYHGLELLPADFSARFLDLFLADRRRPKSRFVKLLSGLGDIYDRVILDCPPGISLLSENVFRCARVLAVPLIPTVLSVNSYRQIESHLATGRGPRLLPFFSMVDGRRRLHREVQEAWEGAEPPVAVPYTTDVEQIAVRRMPLHCYMPRCPAARAYEALWTQIRAHL